MPDIGLACQDAARLSIYAEGVDLTSGTVKCPVFNLSCDTETHRIFYY
ncbi:mCG1035254 [Mus musculus]|nr:mCG1035254 [Mus musculus]